MTYRDSIGRLASKASISVFGGAFSPACYSMHTVINGLDTRKWSIDTPVENIVAEMEADGWVCTVRQDGYNRPVINCIHRETQALIDEHKKQLDEKFAHAERGYIRFGEVPAGGKSINHRDDHAEAGTSCFEAEIAADGSYRLILTPVLEVSYLTVMGRDVYRLYGEVVGAGADGEPLLDVKKAVKL